MNRKGYTSGSFQEDHKHFRMTANILVRQLRTKARVISISQVDLVLIIINCTVENTVISPNYLVWNFCRKVQFPHSFGRKCAFPQNFHTRKLSEITVFFAVLCEVSLRITLTVFSNTPK